MPKLYSSAHIIRVLLRKGFVYISQRGSHMKLRKETGEILTVIIPDGRKEVPFGTFRSILRQSRLEKEDFLI